MSIQNLQQYIVLDIDSTSIGGMLISKKNRKGKKDRVVYYDRQVIHSGKELSFDDFFLKTRRVLENICEKLARHLSGEDFAVYCNMSAPWVSSQKRTIHYEKKSDFEFTKELVEDLIKKEIEQPLIGKDFKSDDGLVLIERRNIDVYANGYPTHKPYGKKMKSVDIHSLSTVMAIETKESFDSIIERYFHRQASYFSNIFMGYQSLKTVLPYEDNIINIDISGRVTEISIIKDDHLVNMGTIPVGTQHILHTLSELLSFSLSKTRSFIEMYQFGVLDEKYVSRVDLAIEKALGIWRKELYDFVDKIAKDGSLPSNICLSSEPTLQQWITELLLAGEELTVHMHASHRVAIIDMRKIFSENTTTDLDIDDQNMLMIHSFIQKIYGT